MTPLALPVSLQCIEKQTQQQQHRTTGQRCKQYQHRFFERVQPQGRNDVLVAEYAAEQEDEADERLAQQRFANTRPATNNTAPWPTSPNM